MEIVNVPALAPVSFNQRTWSSFQALPIPPTVIFGAFCLSADREKSVSNAPVTCEARIRSLPLSIERVLCESGDVLLSSHCHFLTVRALAGVVITGSVSALDR